MEESTPVNPILAKIQFIASNLESAQSIKGVFTMQECKDYTQCVTTLVNFFEKETLATQKEIDALSTFVSLCESQQKTGVFSIKGSVMILDALEEISEALNLLKDPQLKFKELKEKIKHGKK